MRRSVREALALFELVLPLALLTRDNGAVGFHVSTAGAKVPQRG